MTNEEILSEIAELPPEARKRVEDFLKVIRQHYAHQDASSPITSLLDENFVGMWRDREEMTDGTTWVRNLRASEWGQ